MKISWSTAGGGRTTAAATVALVGDLDIVASVDLRETVHHLVDSGHVDLTLDLAGVAFIDCAGVGALVAARRSVREAGGDLVLGPRAHAVTRVLDLVGMRDVFAAA